MMREERKKWIVKMTTTKVCTTEGCERKYYSKNLCRSHYEKSRYMPLITAAVPTTKPCSYDAAHQRVEYWRGRACEHTCVCGSPAEEWSYRNYSEYEMTGQRMKKYPNGSYGPINSRWSRHVKDYDALCKSCHEERDQNM
jgi:hypothetical protein